jgi:hypothetical protein
MGVPGDEDRRAHTNCQHFSDGTGFLFQSLELEKEGIKLGADGGIARGGESGLGGPDEEVFDSSEAGLEGA